MGWNTSAVFVANRSATESLRLLMGGATAVATGDVVTADVATSGYGPDVVYAAEAAGWGQVWDPTLVAAMDLDHAISADASGVAKGTRVLGVLFASVSSSYGFCLYDDAQLVREVFYANGEPVANSGAPLPVESTIAFPTWGPDEDFIWAVIQAVTQTTYADDQRYAAYEVRR